VIQPLLREQRDRPHQPVVLQAQQRRLAVADAGGDHLERFVAAARGIEPTQVGQQVRRQHGHPIEPREGAAATALAHTLELADTPQRGVLEIPHPTMFASRSTPDVRGCTVCKRVSRAAKPRRHAAQAG
jgi:hypothetical protein